MDCRTLKKKYIEFFKSKKHSVIENASLIPENDPTVLFTTAGMHPLVPFLLGEKHPKGKRLVNVQRCIRTGDIDCVGDGSHLTFFEMLGNWSLGDYFKKEAIEWSFEFLTKELKFEKDKISVTVFKGDVDAPKDEESARVWNSLGIPKERIYYLPKDDNWWGPAGQTGPCGPCTEMFIDTGKEECSDDCKPGCGCGKYFEVWNDVFMEYNKTKDGRYEKLKQHNVDTGMGVERTVAMLNGYDNVYETEVFRPILEKIEELESSDNLISKRIITDHIKASVFILGDHKGIVPSNLDQGYILRRLIRRAIRHGRNLGINGNFTKDIARVIIKIYKEDYPELDKNKEFILNELEKEEDKFRLTLEKGLKEFNKLCNKGHICGKDCFNLFSTYGFPIEIVEELCNDKSISLDKKGFEDEFKRHQELSRVGAEKKFKSGLIDASEETTRLHTATHLLHGALRKVLGEHVQQKGSNITPERLRFDFTHNEKMTDEQLRRVETIVNQAIERGLEVKKEIMSLEEAKKKGALAFFGDKYADKEHVSVYHVEGFSKEVCSGPHVSNTKELGHFKIKKEESVAAGVRRIKAVLE